MECEVCKREMIIEADFTIECTDGKMKLCELCGRTILRIEDIKRETNSKLQAINTEKGKIKKLVLEKIAEDIKKDSPAYKIILTLKDLQYGDLPKGIDIPMGVLSSSVGFKESEVILGRIDRLKGWNMIEEKPRGVVSITPFGKSIISCCDPR